MERAKRRRAEPNVPIDVVRDRGRVRRTLARARSAEHVPHMGLADLAHRSVLDQFQRAAERIGGHPLVAHLRRHLPLAGNLPQGPGLGHIMGDRLFHVHVFAPFHGRCRDRGVGVFGSRHDQRVDAAVHFVQHLAEVAVRGRSGMFPHGLRRSPLVRVAHGHQVLAGPGNGVRMIAAPVADAHQGDVQLVVRLIARHGARIPENQPRGRARGRTRQKPAPVDRRMSSLGSPSEKRDQPEV